MTLEKQAVVRKEPAEHRNSTLGGVPGKFQARAAPAGWLTNGGFHAGWFSTVLKEE